jgi:CxxC-x17-CxxC domain-containing protein
MMVTKIYLAAMERVDIAEKDRKDFYLYVDEFQNFATDSFANILSEARKYKLNLIIAHQYIGQLMTDTSTKVRDAVFGNVGTMACFRVGAQDAEFLEPEFTPRFTQEDLVNLAKYQVYLKLMINGVSSDPFSATTLAPIETIHERVGSKEKVVRVSRERYARPRAEIENKIGRWTGMIAAGEGEEEGDEEKGGAATESASPAPGPEWQRARERAQDLTAGMTPPAAPRPASSPSPSAPSRPPPARTMSETIRPTPASAPPRRVPASPPAAPAAPRSAPTPSATPPPAGGGGWLRQSMRGGLSEGVDESEQPDGVRKVIRDSQRPARPRPEPITVECAKCGMGATVFFRPRPGQRVLCENCIRGEKEKAKMAEYEKPRAPKPKTAGAPHASRGEGTGEVPRGRAGAPDRRPPGGAPMRPRTERPASASPAARNAPPPAIDALSEIERGGGSELSLGDLALRAAPPARPHAQSDRGPEADDDEDPPDAPPASPAPPPAPPPQAPPPSGGTLQPGQTITFDDPPTNTSGV